MLFYTIFKNSTSLVTMKSLFLFSKPKHKTVKQSFKQLSRQLMEYIYNY